MKEGQVLLQYRLIAGADTCIRTAGRGPLLMLLHPSPRTGALLIPLMRLLRDRFTVVAPDLPGYGYSSPLPSVPESLYDYVPWLLELCTSLQHGPVRIYGTATGAQLAIAFALSHPEKISRLYLDNCAHFTEAQSADILANYFPDFGPQPDGEHLSRLWDHVRASTEFFPWYLQDADHRIAPHPAPSEALQAMVRDYLLAGNGWPHAYRAAFLHERAANVQRLDVATTIFRWAGSPILRYVDQLLAHPMPPKVAVVETPALQQARYDRMLQHMLSHL